MEAASSIVLLTLTNNMERRTGGHIGGVTSGNFCLDFPLLGLCGAMTKLSYSHVW